jgi:hypothetical protein
MLTVRAEALGDKSAVSDMAPEAQCQLLKTILLQDLVLLVNVWST